VHPVHRAVMAMALLFFGLMVPSTALSTHSVLAVLVVCVIGMLRVRAVFHRGTTIVSCAGG
jgi:fatty-acid desaturase